MTGSVTGYRSRTADTRHPGRTLAGNLWRATRLNACRLRCLSVWIACGLLLGSCSEAKDEYTLPDSANSAIVFAYGHRLTPPFVFTGIDSDTLRLNGFPYSPRRHPLGERTASSTSPDTTLVRRWSEAQDAMRRTLELAYEQKMSTEDAANLAADTLRSYSYVRDVETRKNHVGYGIVGDDGRYGTYFVLGGADTAGPSRAERRWSKIRIFEQTALRKYLFAFGPGYELASPQETPTVEKTLDAMDRVRDGSITDPQQPELRETLLRHRFFFRDVANQGP